MRISTNMIFEQGTSQLGTLNSNIAKTQMQLSTNRRVLTAADDPIAAARALEVTQSQSVNTQYGVNRQNARTSLSLEEQTLAGTTSLIQDVQTLVVNAGNATLSDTDRKSLAIELQGRLDDMLALANTADGTGGYLFSGFKSNTLPFTKTASGAQYNGDQGARTLQISSARQAAISDSGSEIFENNVTGNGTFVAAAGGANTGAGIISSGSVVNGAAATGHNYQLTFAVSGTPAVTTYSVLDQTTGLPPPTLPAPVPYASGEQITFDGITFDIKGVPANGDSFSVKPSQKQSIFQTLTDLIGVLKSPGTGPVGQANLTNGLNKAHENLGSSLDNVLSVRASVGARLKEMDTLDSAGDDLNLQYAATLKDLVDLDQVAAISQFTQQQFALEAAQKSFKTLSGLSLFNFIS
ncbi:MAG TPA: flagellar hook-associated protein FlgL [Telluria sp.]|jgi:flagellar hook-associated protein 3 FlgL